MFEYIVTGSGLAFAAAIQPGPLQAFLLSSVAQRGWKRTLPASLSPLISDGPVALLTLLLLSRLQEGMNRALELTGGGFLVYLAWASYRGWKAQSAAGDETKDSGPGTLLQAVVVNILNPNPYLGWSLVLGPTFLAAWSQSPANAVALLIAFYGTMVSVLAGSIVLFGTTRFLGPTARRSLIFVSAIILALFGIYRIVVSLMNGCTV